MIYTIVPIEQVLDTDYSENDKMRTIHALYMGEEVLLSRNDEGEYSVERLISTNPGSYLRKELMPGNAADVKGIKLF